MKILYEWGIQSAGFLIWIVLTFIIVPALVRYLKKKTDQTQRTFRETESLPESAWPRTHYGRIR